MDRSEALLCEENLPKLARFCAYRERCKSEVIRKMNQLGLQKNHHERCLKRLMEQGFLDERRYAEAFVSGKLRMNRWGRRKIIAALRKKQIPAELIDRALSTIDDEEYLQILSKEAIKYHGEPLVDLTPIERQKLFGKLLAKGFETDFIRELIGN